MRPETQPIEPPGRVGILDIIEMKESLRIAHSPDVVVVLDSFHATDPDAFVGRSVRLLTQAGRTIVGRVEAVRDHGATISFFFRDLTRKDLPDGSWIEFDD